MQSHYLAGYAALVNCDLLELSSILYRKETRQHALGIMSVPPSTNIANRVFNTPTQTLLTGRPAPHPTQPPAQT